MPAFSRVGRPVEIDARRARGRRGEARAGGADEAGDFLGALLLHPKQHQKGPELLGQNLSGQDHRHGLLGFVDGQRAGQRLAAAEDVDEAGERMRVSLHAGGVLVAASCARPAGRNGMTLEGRRDRKPRRAQRRSSQAGLAGALGTCARSRRRQTNVSRPREAAGRGRRRRARPSSATGGLPLETRALDRIRQNATRHSVTLGNFPFQTRPVRGNDPVSGTFNVATFRLSRRRCRGSPPLVGHSRRPGRFMFPARSFRISQGARGEGADSP